MTKTQKLQTSFIHALLLAALALSATACGPLQLPSEGDPGARMGAYAEESTLFSCQASNATANSTTVTVRAREAGWIQIGIDGTSAPVGTLKVMGYVGTDATYAQPLPLAEIFTDNAAITHTTNSSTISVASTVGTGVVGHILIAIENPPPRVYIQWTRSSGGTTGSRLCSSLDFRG